MRQHFISSVRPLLWDPKMVTSSCCWQVCKLPELVNIAKKDEGNLGLYAHGFWFLVCVTNNAVDVQFSNSMRGFSRVIWKETEVSYTNWKSVGNVYDFLFRFLFRVFSFRFSFQVCISLRKLQPLHSGGFRRRRLTRGLWIRVMWGGCFHRLVVLFIYSSFILCSFLFGQWADISVVQPYECHNIF